MANILQKRQVHCYNGNSIAEGDKYIAKREKSIAIKRELIATKDESVAKGQMYCYKKLNDCVKSERNA